ATEELKNQPEVLASVIDAVGHTLRSLGSYDQAESLLISALEQRRKILAPDHLDLAMSLHHLAWLHHERGRYETAKPLYEEALAIRSAKLPADDPLVTETMLNLAWLLGQMEELIDAERLMIDVIELRRKHWKTDEHRDVGIAKVGLAAVYLEHGRFLDA